MHEIWKFIGKKNYLIIVSNIFLCKLFVPLRTTLTNIFADIILNEIYIKVKTPVRINNKSLSISSLSNEAQSLLNPV